MNMAGSLGIDVAHYNGFNHDQCSVRILRESQGHAGPFRYL